MDGASVKAYGLSNIADLLSLSFHPGNDLDLLGGGFEEAAFLRSAPANAAFSGSGLASNDSLRLEFTLEGSDTRHDVGQKSARGTLEVDALLEADQVDLSGLQFLEQLAESGGVPSQPIQAPAHHLPHVAGVDLRLEPLPTGPTRVSAGRLVAEPSDRTQPVGILSFDPPVNIRLLAPQALASGADAHVDGCHLVGGGFRGYSCHVEPP